MSTITGVHHIAVRAADFERSLRFYTDTLGLSVTATWQTRNGRAAFVEVSPRSYIEIFERPAASFTGKPAILHVCLRTADVDGMTERVRAAGYPVTVEPTFVDLETSIGPTRMRLSFVDGPDGEEIEFMSSDDF